MCEAAGLEMARGRKGEGTDAVKVSRTFWSSHAKSAPVNLWFTLSLPPGSHGCVHQCSTTQRCALLCFPPERLLQPSRAHQRKDFLVISLNFPSLAFITLLISCNPLARSSSVKWPYKPTCSTSQGLISSPVPPPCLSSLPMSLDKPCPGVFGVIQPCSPKPVPSEQGGHSKNLLELQRSRVKIQQTPCLGKVGC